MSERKAKWLRKGAYEYRGFHIILKPDGWETKTIVNSSAKFEHHETLCDAKQAIDNWFEED